MENKYKILMLSKDPIQIKELKKKINITWGNLSKTISRLEKQGLIDNVGIIKSRRVIQTNIKKLNDVMLEQQTLIAEFKKAGLF